MKRQTVITIGAMGILMLAAVFTNAQSAGNMIVDIPFDFSAGSTTLPAGSYNIERVNRSTGDAVLAFRSVKGGTSAIVMMRSAVVTTNRSGEPALLFNRYGSEHFLSEVRNPADNFGGRVPPAKREKNLARTYGSKPAAVAVIGTTK